MYRLTQKSLSLPLSPSLSLSLSLSSLLSLLSLSLSLSVFSSLSLSFLSSLLSLSVFFLFSLLSSSLFSLFSSLFSLLSSLFSLLNSLSLSLSHTHSDSLSVETTSHPACDLSRTRASRAASRPSSPRRQQQSGARAALDEVAFASYHTETHARSGVSVACHERFLME